VQPRNDSIEATLVELRETSAVDAVTHLLEELAVLVDAAAEGGSNDVVADAIAEIVASERDEKDAERKRAFTMALRRFARPVMLRVIARALPKRRDRADAYAAALVRMGEPGAEAVIAELTESESMNERRVYFDTLLKLRAALPKIIALLGDSRWYVVRNAADLLAEMPTPEAELPLAKLLKHADERVRRAAAVALGKVGTASASSALRSALTDDSAQVRLAAAAGLGSWKSRTSTQLLTVAFDEEGDGDVQLQIISTLGRVGTPDAIERLTELAMPGAFFRKKATAHRIAAVQALGETRAPAAIKVLQQLDDDKDPAVRAAVVQAMNALRAAARSAS
jgi:HEAT repeat protein